MGIPAEFIQQRMEEIEKQKVSFEPGFNGQEKEKITQEKIQETIGTKDEAQK